MPYDPEHHGPRRIVGPGFHERVYAAVIKVPAGHVTTYGDVAASLGLRSAARQVGFALAALPDERSDVPWHRVLNGQGRVTARGDGAVSSAQVQCLRRDGCTVGGDGRVSDFEDRRFCFE